MGYEAPMQKLSHQPSTDLSACRWIIWPRNERFQDLHCSCGGLRWGLGPSLTTKSVDIARGQCLWINL